MLLWDIGVATSKKGGKPPPESKRKIDSCHLSQHILPKAHFKNTILFPDGAPAYPAVAEKLNVQHEFVNHSEVCACNCMEDTYANGSTSCDKWVFFLFFSNRKVIGTNHKS